MTDEAMRRDARQEHIEKGCACKHWTNVALSAPAPAAGVSAGLDGWWTDGAMVNGGLPGDEHFVGDAATPDDAARIVEAHNAALARSQEPQKGDMHMEDW